MRVSYMDPLKSLFLCALLLPLCAWSIDDYPNGETLVNGSLSGSYLDTLSSDNQYESITERSSGGKPANRYSFLEHVWTIDVTGGTDVTLFIEAYQTASSDGDTFEVSWSENGSTYTPLLTITATSDTNSYLSASLPSSTVGTIYIRVLDTDQTSGNNQLDTLFVDELFVTSSGELPNQAPQVNAGADAFITLPANVVALDGTVSDDGLPNPPGSLTTSWSVLSGPGSVTFGDASSVDTSAQFSAEGVYTLELSADDSVLQASDTVVVTVNPEGGGGTGSFDDFANADVPTSGNVTGDFTRTQSSDNDYESITEVESGGKPSNRRSFLEHTWTFDLVGNADSVTFNVEAYHTANSEGDDFTFAYSLDGNAYTNMLTVSAVSDTNMVQSFALPSNLSGTLFVRVTDDDQSQGNRSLDTIYVDQMYVRSTGVPNGAPVVDAGSDQSIILPTDTVSLDGTVTDDGLPAPSMITASWSVISGPGSVTFGDSSAVDTTAQFGAEGTYVLRLTADDSILSSFDELTVIVNPAGSGNNFFVSSAADISIAMATAQPGDTLIMTNGTWSNEDIVFSGNGSNGSPITLIAETPGQVVLTGSSRIRMGGSYLVIDGLKFEGGTLSNGQHVVEFRQSSSELASNCRLTNTAIIDYNPSNSSTDYRWVGIYGTNNRVDHCYFSGKNNQGPLMIVWRVDGVANFHQIDSNYFGDFASGGGLNGWETIRIGTSSDSLSDSSTTVENNLFLRCDGEIEIISVKSGDNRVLFNTFDSCQGMVTLRHGRGSLIEGNFFFGRGVPNSGGVRVIDSDHVVINNYLEGLRGTSADGALVIANGENNPALNGYFPVERALVAFNTVYDCTESLRVGWRASSNPIAVKDSVIANNAIRALSSSASQIVIEDDPPVNMLYEGNLFFGVPMGISPVPSGISETDPQLALSNGLYRPGAGSPCIDGSIGAYSQVFEDIDGQSRPGVDTDKDVGADEVSGSAVSREPLVPADVGTKIGPSWL